VAGADVAALKTSDRAAAHAFLAGGGEMGACTRELDWSTSPVGAVERWPQSLKGAVSICLGSRHPIVIWWGRSDHTQFYNDAYIPILGRTKHPQWLGRSGRECWSEIWPAMGPMIESVYGTGEATWSEDFLFVIDRNRPREEGYFTFSYSPIRDDDGAVSGIFCACNETTERVIGERRLRTLRDLGRMEAEARTAEAACEVAARTLDENPGDVPFALIYLLESDADHARLIATTALEMGNAAAPRRIDLKDISAAAPSWPLGQVLATGTTQLIPNVSAMFGALPGGLWPEPPEVALIVPIAAPGQSRPTGFLVSGLSPRRVTDADYRSFLDLVAGHIGTSIANARAYEEERKRAEALAEIDRAKTAFFSNVSHEFRTPLTLMLGPLENALAVPPEELPQRREDLALVHRSSLRLLRLVNTLLDFSRIEAGRVEASYEPTDLSAYTLELASVFRSTTERAGLQLTLDCPPNEAPVWVDRDMWEKIVLNLLSNAFKFTLQGGITVRLRQHDGNAVLEIRDTGTGIPEHELPLLFDRFHRVEGARGRTHEGTGIGLALVLELTHLHGGTVRAESIYGAGSTFTVTIPLGAAHLPADRLRAQRTLATTALGAQPYVEEALGWLPGAAPLDVEPNVLAEPLRASEPEGERAAVLLADDNADMRDYVQRLLAPRYEVRTVPDGAAALQALGEQRPDLLLTDVMMPELDGFGLLRVIRADPGLGDLPVILLSARAGEEASSEGLDAGADDYLIKPFSARELLARVRANLEMARMRREAKLRLAADLQAMTRLREVGERCIRAGNDFHRCLEDLLDTAIEVTGANKGNIQLFDTEAGTLHIAAQRGFKGSFLEFFASVGRGDAAVCGTALQSAERVIVEDVTQSEIFTGQPSLDILLESGVRAVQSTPLVSGAGTVFGIISTHFSHPHRPSERDLRLMDLLARQAADYLERKKTEGAAQAVSAELKQILDTSATGLTHCSRELRYVSANPAYAKVAGVPLEQIIGCPIAKVMGEQAFDMVRPYIERTLRGERVEYEIELPWAANGPKWTHFVYTPCQARDGSISGWVGSVRDVTERKHAEMALRELNEHLEQKVEERTRAFEEEMAERQKVEAMLQKAQRLEAIGQLTGGVAHDFNNLLTVILANVDLLQTRLRDADNAWHLIAAVERAALRGAQLTGQLLAFSRRQQLQPVALSVQRSILNLGDLVRRAVGEAVTVEISADPGLWPSRLDPARFESAILNLAVNARDAMPEGGRLVIRSRNVTVTEAEAMRLDLAPGDYVRVKVTDTGTGMAPDVQRRAFEPFFTTKDVGKGTGLGLAQIYGFVKQSGGTATINSTPGKGTTVSLYLPRAETEVIEEQPPARERDGARGNGKTILVVEDQPDLLEVIEMFLNGLDYRILKTADGVAARKLLESDEAIDLLLTDVVMPNGVSGLDLAQDARRLRQDLKIVLVSGYLRDIDKRSDGVGGLIFLEKPFRQTELADTIAAALGE
jgi:PAS domain S-box-containing protein